MDPSGSTSESLINTFRIRARSARGGLCECALYGGSAEQIRWLWQAPALASDAPTALDEALAGVKDGPIRLIRAMAQGDAGRRVLESSALIRDVWRADGGLGPYPLLEVLAENEYGNVYYRGYRDHLVHQLRVWVLGLYLISRMPRLLEALVDEVRAEEEFSSLERPKVVHEALRRFKIAALWHDIGYVFEIQGAEDEKQRVERVFDVLNSTFETPIAAQVDDAKLTEDKERLWQREANEIDPLPRWIKLSGYEELVEGRTGRFLRILAPAGLAAGLAEEDEPTGGFGPYLDLCWKRLLRPGAMSRPGFVDHGIAGALLLLRLHWFLCRYSSALAKLLHEDPDLANEYSRSSIAAVEARQQAAKPAIAAAARAVALHNVVPHLPRRSEVGASGLTPDRYRLRLKADEAGEAVPLAYVLALADGLQGWDRPGFVAPKDRGDVGLDGNEVDLSADQKCVFVHYVVDEDEAVTRRANLRQGLGAYLHGIPSLVRPGVADPLAPPHARELISAPQTSPPPVWEMEPYLDEIIKECGTIELRGIVQSGSTRAVPSVPIEDLYTPLQAEGASADLWQLIADPGLVEHRLGEARGTQPQEREVERPRALVLVGGPGSGKSTFLKMTATVLARALKGDAAAAKHDVVAALRCDDGAVPVPVFLRLSELARYAVREAKRSSWLDDDPRILSRYIEQWTDQRGTGIPAREIEQWLRDNQAILLLDGLDEVPSQGQRDSLWRMLHQALSKRLFGSCRFCLTSRPLPEGVNRVLVRELSLAGLGSQAVERFLLQWSKAVAPNDPGVEPEQHMQDLLDQVGSASASIRAMLRNPLMLTCLAVVHWNEARLPEQRAELLDAIVSWLLSQRRGDVEDVPKVPVSIRRSIFQTLALAMHSRSGGRVREISLAEAARAVMEHLEGSTEQARLDAAQSLLEWEVIGSGIINQRPDGIELWHLSFQELLVADALRHSPDAVWPEILSAERLADPVWREVVLLLGGLLGNSQRTQELLRLIVGPARQGSLAEKARAYGLANGVVRDLEPLHFKADDDIGLDELSREVMRIFEPEGVSVPLKVRVEAADALGRAGDPRLVEPAWVEISNGLWIGKYPVTVQEYARFVEEGGYQPEVFGEELRVLWVESLEALLADERYEPVWERYQGDSQRMAPAGWEDQLLTPSRPVVEVSWCEAASYCRWLARKETGSWSYGLPTEAEWERAAAGRHRRGKYPWGDEDPGKGDQARANFDGAGIGHPSPVGLFPCGAADWGEAGQVHDIAGNAWEWCNDPVDSDGKQDDSGLLRPLRGGGYWHDASYLEVSAPRWSRAALRYDVIGFRVVRWRGAARPRLTS